MERNVHVCSIDMEKTFVGVRRDDMEYMKQRGIIETLKIGIQSLYRGTINYIRGRQEVSNKFQTIIGVRQGSLMSLFLLTLVLDESIRR